MVFTIRLTRLLSLQVDRYRAQSFSNNSMLKIFAAVISILFAIATSAPLVQRSDSVHGFDVSNHQNYTIDFSGAYTSGARFVIIKVRLHLYIFVRHEYWKQRC